MAKQQLRAFIITDTTPTSSVFTVGTSAGVNGDGDITYLTCGTMSPDYKNLENMKGNANADGPYVELGFRPALLIFKRMDGT